MLAGAFGDCDEVGNHKIHTQGGVRALGRGVCIFLASLKIG